MSASRRILIALPETGYFRLYGTVIRALADEGWQVLLAFDRPDKRGAAQLPEGAPAAVQSIGAIPEPASSPLAGMRGAVDYLRYLEAPFAHAAYLRRRSEKSLAPAFRFLAGIRRVPRVLVGAAIRAMRALDALVAADAGLRAWVRLHEPDVLFVSPLVTLGASGDRQTELVKAARAAGVPVIVGAASWDHLTSKGLVRLVPDALLVWNQAQVEEAVDLHRLPRSKVVTTGAQSLDHWFAPSSPASTAAFRSRLGVEPDRALILFVGSSRNMAPGTTEVEFARRWIAAIRASQVAPVRDAAIVVRPHPTNAEPWIGAELGPGVVVHPSRYSGIPLTSDEIETFRESLLACAAVVGINTTAMIEAAILDRPVLTVRDGAFAHSQAETLHFAHLPLDAGGCVMVADGLVAHVRQLEQVLSDSGAAVAAARRFVARFVRPLGVGEPATAHVCRAIAAVAARTRPHGAMRSTTASADTLARQGSDLR